MLQGYKAAIDLLAEKFKFILHGVLRTVADRREVSSPRTMVKFYFLLSDLILIYCYNVPIVNSKRWTVLLIGPWLAHRSKL